MVHINQVIYCTKRIDNLHFTGRVKIGGEDWKAQSYNEEIIEEGSTVQVAEVEGSKVIVKKENETIK